VSEREYAFNALLLADKVITENNGKKGLIGIFNMLNLSQVPGTSPSWMIYASLSNVTGSHEVVFNLAHDDSGVVILSVGGELNAPETTAEVEVILPIQNCRFPREGRYTLTMKIDGSYVASRVVTVRTPKSE